MPEALELIARRLPSNGSRLPFITPAGASISLIIVAISFPSWLFSGASEYGINRAWESLLADTFAQQFDDANSDRQGVFLGSIGVKKRNRNSLAASRQPARTRNISVDRRKHGTFGPLVFLVCRCPIEKTFHG